MTTLNQELPGTSGVVSLQQRAKGTSLWVDSWKRLRRNKAAMLGLAIVLLNVFVAIFAPLIAPKSYDQQVLVDNNAAPRWVIDLFPTMKAKGEESGYVTVSDDYLVGADNLGRDLFSRIVYGTRVSLMVAIIGPTVSILVGMLVGMLAGYFGGRLDNLLMRIVDIMYAFPTLLLIILLMTFFRTGFANPEPGTLAETLSKLDA
ncbi:MAG: ABC transporter permease, partial [Armatimonadetes bacterium]|nr:ABC transporter permease [Anaerolineae bacterium]